MRLLPTLTALACLISVPALAEDYDRVRPVSDAVVQKECGACHIPFPAVFMNAQAWTQLTGDLAHHFGEDAGLPADKLKAVQAYYSQNAGRSQAGLVRISQQSWWLREHRAVGQSKFAAAKSKANCQACHTEADKGIFEH